MKSTYRIHLFYEEEAQIDFLGRKFDAPDWMQYGHVYCVLEKDGEHIDIGIDGWGDPKERPQWWDLKGWFNLALNKGHVRHLDIETLFIHSEDTGNIASFTITEEAYDRVLENARSRLEQKSPYDRLRENCVKYAADDLRLAGIDIGRNMGYTAGRFFKKVKPMSEGNLIYVDGPIFPEIEVVETELPIALNENTTREVIILDVESFFDEPET